MTVKYISRSISTKECCRPQLGLNPRPPGLQSDGASNWATKAGSNACIFTHCILKNYIICYLHKLFSSVTNSWLRIFVFLIVPVLFLICFKWPPPPLTAILFHLSSPLFCFHLLIYFCYLAFLLISDSCLWFIFHVYLNVFTCFVFLDFISFDWSPPFIAIHFSPLQSFLSALIICMCRFYFCLWNFYS